MRSARWSSSRTRTGGWPRALSIPRERARTALRAEMAYYREHHDIASDAAGLARLRDACTEVLREALGGSTLTHEELLATLLGRAALPSLSGGAGRPARAARGGATLVVVSNWDVSLHDVLEGTGLRGLVDAVLTSAEVGEAKPGARDVPRRAGAGRRRAARSAARGRLDRARRRGRARRWVCTRCSWTATGAAGAGAGRGAMVSDPRRRADGSAPYPAAPETMSIPPPSYAHPGPPPEHPERPEGAPERPRRSGLPPWRWWMGLVGVAIGLGIPIVLGVIAAIGVEITGGDAGDLPPGVLIALTFFQDLGFIAAALFVARMARRPTARDFGLVGTPFWRAVGIVVAVYVGFYVITGIWASLLNLDEQSDLPDELGADTSTAALVAVLVLVCIMAPVAEEFLFRGLLFTSLRASTGLWPAAIITGAVFGAIHVGSSPVGFLVPLAVLGLGLCLIYAWTRSLYPCVALHAINNAIAFGVTQDWTWEIPLLVVGGTGVSLLIVMGIGRALGRGGAGRVRILGAQRTCIPVLGVPYYPPPPCAAVPSHSSIVTAGGLAVAPGRGLGPDGRAVAAHRHRARRRRAGDDPAGHPLPRARDRQAVRARPAGHGDDASPRAHDPDQDAHRPQGRHRRPGPHGIRTAHVRPDRGPRGQRPAGGAGRTDRRAPPASHAGKPRPRRARAAGPPEEVRLRRRRARRLRRPHGARGARVPQGGRPLAHRGRRRDVLPRARRRQGRASACATAATAATSRPTSAAR